MESVLLRVFLFALVSNCLLSALPVSPANDNSTATDAEALNNTSNSTNGTARDLYVIRTIIYEVGILTDADNDTDDSTETHEQVDLTFYDPQHNGSIIDLSNIPIPYQTNVSGQVITGIAPANFGTIALNSSAFTENGTKITGHFPLKAPIYPNFLISHTSNISTTNPEQEQGILENLASDMFI